MDRSRFAAACPVQTAEQPGLQRHAACRCPGCAIREKRSDQEPRRAGARGHRVGGKGITQMRVQVLWLTILLSLFVPESVRAEIQILAPPVVSNAGLKNIADAFTRKTGNAVTIRSLELLKIPESATAQPTDIVFLTPDLMDGLARANSVKGETAVGRVNIG